MADITKTLTERGSRYGDFGDHARITQAIKRAMTDSPNWGSLPDDMREALEMLAHKVGRILNGDPTFHDSWHDIIGYTKLVADKLDPDAKRTYEVSHSGAGAPFVGDDEPPLRAGSSYGGSE